VVTSPLEKTMQRVDEKGKFFTERVSKGQVDVFITTSTGHIRGFIYVAHEQRIKDMLNSHTERFIAVTDATSTAYDGSDVLEVDLMTVNKDHIISVVPIGRS
jgi:hypothetical protein